MLTPAYFAFFRELADDNEKVWFEANRARYERDVKEPLLAIIRAVAAPMAEISPHIKVDPRANGGSMFRIYRDTRFSKDKAPYKTNGAVHFRHVAGKDAHAPGYYLHLAPDDVFVAGGLWAPEPEVAARIRETILARPDAWRAAVEPLTPGMIYEMESYKRPPAGVPADHPLLADLKRKHFIFGRKMTEAQTFDADFLPRVLADWRAMAPVMRFLTNAVGLEF